MLPFLLLVPLKKSLPRLRIFLTALRTTTHPTLPLGACGYCWSAKHVITLASESIHQIPENETKQQPQQPLLTAAFVAYPASRMWKCRAISRTCLHTPSPIILSVVVLRPCDWVWRSAIQCPAMTSAAELDPVFTGPTPSDALLRNSLSIAID